jgi:hypothetical protein
MTYFLKQKSSVSINAEKTNNAPNYVEKFKVPTALMVMFHCHWHWHWHWFNM